MIEFFLSRSDHLVHSEKRKNHIMAGEILDIIIEYLQLETNPLVEILNRSCEFRTQTPVKIKNVLVTDDG